MKKCIFLLPLLLGLTPIKTTNIDDFQSVSNSNFTDIDTKQKVYDNNITYGYFHGRTNVADRDFASGVSPFNHQDGTTQTLDLSSIIPEGTKAVLIRVEMSDDAANSELMLKQYGYTNNIVCGKALTQVANIPVEQLLIVSVGTDRRLQYRCTNTTWTSIYLTICGWWK
jgi:hypothetical protein